MGALQTTYTDGLAIGQVGRRANAEEWNTITRTFETAGVIGFAQPVQRGAGAHGCVAYSSGSFLGLTEADPTGDSSTADRYRQYQNVAICETGVIYATALSTCTIGTLVYWNAASGKYTSTSSGNVLIPNAEFETGATADNQIVAIRIKRVPRSATA